MKIEHILDAVHSSVTNRWHTQLFTAFVRVILAVGFIPPSIPKILHRPFTVLPDSNPVGHYFNALYATGFYYEFIGWSQLIAAALLLFPRTAHVGALMFFPIVTNIAILTVSVGFAGTWLIALLMCFAALWLVAWEYDRLKPIVFSTRSAATRILGFQFLWIPAAFAVGAAAMAVIWRIMRLGNFSNYLTVGIGLTIAGLIFGLVVALHYRYMTVGSLTKRSAELR
jgi:hypothetical protein